MAAESSISVPPIAIHGKPRRIHNKTPVPITTKQVTTGASGNSLGTKV
jgi:hypothetical protein